MKKKILIIIIFVIILLVMIFINIIKNNKDKIENDIGKSNMKNSFDLIYEREDNLNINKIIGRGEVQEYNYNIYTFGGNVKIKIDNEIIDIKQALIEKRIKIEDIINQCIKYEEENNLDAMIYYDGGSRLYQNKEYWILKCHNEDGNRDVYIGMPNMYYSGNTVKLNTKK